MSPITVIDIPAALDAAYEHLAAGRFGHCETLCRRILGAEPREPDALHCLASVAFQMGHVDAAIDLVRSAIESKPGSASFLNDLGTMLRARGRNEDAIASYRQSLARDSSHAVVHYNLANTLRAQRNLAAAVECYTAAIAAEPDFADAHFHLGNVLAEQGKVEEAAQQFEVAVAIHPVYAAAYYNLGNARADQGRLHDAVAAYRRVLAIEPGFVEAHSNLLWTMQYMDSVPPQAAFAEALEFARRQEVPLRSNWVPHANSREPERRLKVGYVSPDFRRHSVAYFAEPLIQLHNRNHFEVFCYYNNAVSDAVTQRFVAIADHWVPCRDLDDTALAARIRQDGIDILVDLSGHTAHHRLLTFARKPAPIQITYLGYPATTGLSSIDYRMTDIHADPPGSGDECYTEQLIRLPASFLCYRPPEAAPAVSPAPVLRNGYVTFGSFNALPKITDRVIALWSQILTLLPSARMFLKSAGLERDETRERILSVFESHGIERERILLSGRDADFDEHMARYSKVDIGLDPFPYNGTATTFEAAWMGAPTVTLRCDRHAGRVGASLLANAGMPELIAQDEEAYVRIALEFAGNHREIHRLRMQLRERLLSSPLLDAKRLAQDIESAYRKAWKAWCAVSP